jgi:hypothetical protein
MLYAARRYWPGVTQTDLQQERSGGCVAPGAGQAGPIQTEISQRRQAR